jgi:hypothetical protein
MNSESPPSPERHPPSAFVTLFNLADPTERFMAGWISRIHLNWPRLYQALAIKRSDRLIGDKPERLIYEVARFTGQPACYSVITWNIDELSMRWQDFARRREALVSYRLLK